ncbi:hypothetical protein AALF16_00205 [Bacillus cereus]|uniref:hypothetical protein n=1 Tax=Bacillus cereus TaxID=1396 RepID=UPI00356EBD63
MSETTWILQESKQHKYIRIHYSMWFFLALFLFNETIRSVFETKLASFNILSLMISISAIVYFFSKRRIALVPFYFAVFISAVILMNSIWFLHYDNRQLILTIVSILIPVYLMSIRLTKTEALRALQKFLFLFNLLIIFLLCFGLMDYLTNRALQLEMAGTIFKNSDLGKLILNENLSSIYRLYSFMGHPLSNAKYFLCFFILNFIYNSKRKAMIPSPLIIVITTIGLLLSGSKTALFLLLLLLFVHRTKYRSLYYVGIVIFLLFLFQSSLFQDNLLQRFTNGIENNDISSGRNDLITELLTSGGELPNFLFGKGENYSRIVAQSFHDDTQNFEYPLIMLAYDYGLVVVGIIYFLCFLYPAYVLLKKKEYRIFIYYIVWSMMINSYNAMANLGNDTFAQVCFIALIIQNLVNDGGEEI